MAEHPPYPVEVITPEGVAFAGNAEILVVPGAAGDLGILSNHAPLISLLKPGETRITDEAGDVKRYATDDGYVQVRAEPRCGAGRRGGRRRVDRRLRGREAPRGGP